MDRDEAFAQLDDEVVNFLTSDEGTESLERILEYHVIFGEILTSNRLRDGEELTTLEGGTVTVTLDPIAFDGAVAVEVDVLANNGVLHKIDSVLMPAL